MRRWLAFTVVAGCSFDPSAATTDGAGVGTSDGSTPRADAAPIPDAAPALMCPSGSGWFQLAGSGSAGAWMFTSSDSKSWKDAEAECESMQLVGGSAIHLAVLPTTDQLAAVAAVAQQGGGADFWIGMFQQGSQSAPDVGWLWVTGGSGYGGGSAWSPGEPDDKSSIFGSTAEDDDEDFAEVYSTGLLNDAKESKSYQYVCECDGVAVPASVWSLVP